MGRIVPGLVISDVLEGRAKSGGGLPPAEAYRSGCYVERFSKISCKCGIPLRVDLFSTK